MVKILVFELPGCIYIGVTPTGLQLIFNKYHQALSVLNVFFNYFVSSNGPNWEVICIIPIFGVIFGKNLVFAPPPGCLYIGVTPTGLQLIWKTCRKALF